MIDQGAAAENGDARGLEGGAAGTGIQGGAGLSLLRGLRGHRFAGAGEGRKGSQVESSGVQWGHSGLEWNR